MREIRAPMGPGVGRDSPLRCESCAEAARAGAGKASEIGRIPPIVRNCWEAARGSVRHSGARQWCEKYANGAIGTLRCESGPKWCDKAEERGGWPQWCGLAPKWLVEVLAMGRWALSGAKVVRGWRELVRKKSAQMGRAPSMVRSWPKVALGSPHYR